MFPSLLILIGITVVKNESDSKKGFKEKFLINTVKSGSLNGLTFSAKDVFELEGYKTGFGSPVWEQTHPIAVENAICIDQLLHKGATCFGKAITGELGCGSAGTNHFYGMPINPRAPRLTPGGSSSGSAVSVANGEVDFSIATDSGGSVRVPASFCGILGMRPSYGLISMAGVTSLAPSLDTVGILANEIEVLSKVMKILLGCNEEIDESARVGEIYIIEDLIDFCDDRIKEAIDFMENECQRLFYTTVSKIKLADVESLANHPDLGIGNTFLEIFCAETWTSISSWVNEVSLEYGKDTYVDFTYMKNLDKTNLNRAFLRKEIYFKKLNELLSPYNLLLIPTTPFGPIARPEKNAKVNEFNYAKLRPLISLASIGQLPQVNIPIFSKNGFPIGISLLAAHRKDVYLIEVAKKVMYCLQELIGKNNNLMLAYG